MLGIFETQILCLTINIFCHKLEEKIANDLIEISFSEILLA